MTFDIDVGFKTRPEGLDEFLIKEHYQRTKGNGRNGVNSDYEHKDGWPQLFYIANYVGRSEGEFDWRANTQNGIVALLNINFPMKASLDVEARRLATLLIKKFDAVAHDPSSEEFYDTGDSLE